MPFSVFPLTENVEPFLACHILNFLNRFLFVFCNYFIKTDCKLTLKGNSMLLCASQVAQQVQGLIPGSGRSPGGGNGNPVQYSCLENPMDRGAWQAVVLGVSESDMTEHAHVHTALLMYP